MKRSISTTLMPSYSFVARLGQHDQPMPYILRDYLRAACCRLQFRSSKRRERSRGQKVMSVTSLLELIDLTHGHRVKVASLSLASASTRFGTKERTLTSAHIPHVIRYQVRQVLEVQSYTCGCGDRAVPCTGKGATTGESFCNDGQHAATASARQTIVLSGCHATAAQNTGLQRRHYFATADGDIAVTAT